jgi:hypothetical protein
MAKTMSQAEKPTSTKAADSRHVALALQARRDANLWQAASRDWALNRDQVEQCRDYASDYRRIAREHLADARLAKAKRRTSRWRGQMSA